MEEVDISTLNNNNELLKDVVKKLENIINDLNDKKEKGVILPQITEIITTVKNVINDNTINIEQLKKEINKMKGENKTKTYKNGKYKGQFKNDLKDGKGVYYYNDDNRYEGEWKNDLKEGKGTFFRIMEIDMKENLKIIKWKEEVFFIIMMEINMKENGKMI